MAQTILALAKGRANFCRLLCCSSLVDFPIHSLLASRIRQKIRSAKLMLYVKCRTVETEEFIRFRLRGYHPLWPAFPGNFG